jgi:antitoxin VapB
MEMAIHVRDPETDALVRELARRRGIGITEAIREAVDEALKSKRQADLWQATEEIREKLKAYPETGEVVDKRFFDELWEQEDDD